MARLSIRLLGPFEVTLAGQPITHFASDKVRALLAYLVVEAGQPHRRETLAGLLWPEMPEATARANLRYTLSDLRTAIGDREAAHPSLHITRQTIQFDQASDAWVDVLAYCALVGGDQLRGQTIQGLEDAVELVRGEFLHGFSLGDSVAFEEWLLLQREHFTRLQVAALHRLVAFHQAQGTFETALRYSWQLVRLEPYEEEAHQQLMHLLALTGQRSAAMLQFQSLRQILRDELGLEPSATTLSLYRRILSGEIAPQEAAKRDRIIRGYDLLERIGVGTFGAVYRAYQPVLGREVAVKIILPEYANRLFFIRRFEAEAQMVARLEHPHIVPLYDYWREPEGAYLVMRYYATGSLADSLASGSWPLEPAVRLVDQVASALAVAHDRGVIHRDVKPANILLDDKGNAYLSDFSIARELTPDDDALEPEALSISPEYAAPEQWLGLPLTPRVDVYSLGVVLYELLTGVHPFRDTPPGELSEKHLRQPLPPARDVRPALPEAVDGVLRRATAKAPEERYPDLFSLAEAFRQSVVPTVGEVPTAIEISRGEPQNPYKGLHPFQEVDAPHFFGREAMAEHLLARLGAAEPYQRSLALVGPTGSGKSSLVRAGMLPALRMGALPGSESWFVATMQPGTAPVEELAAALLGVAVRGEEGLREALGEDQRGLLRAAEMALPEQDGELLLFVDQFEELYGAGVNEAERDHFLQLLWTAVTAHPSRVRVILSLRADFHDRPLRHPQLSQLMRRRTEVIVPLTPGELADAIRGPARRVGVELEEGLAEAIVADVARQVGALPMFQYALTELFERRQGRLLTWDAYRVIGGVGGALARRAEEVYGGLDEGGQAMARQAFLRLVTLGDGQGDGAASAARKRRVPLTELREIQAPAGSTPAEVLETMLDTFGRARLLLFDHDPATRSPTVEVAHEALLQAWDRLRDWLEESWADLRMERLLAVATQEWMETGRDPGFLLRGSRLALFESWAAESSVALTREEGGYLEVSVAAHQAREAEREARRQRELEAARALAEEQQKRADEQAQNARRLRQRALYLAGALLLAVLLAAAAGLFGQQARQNANLAATREIEALANADLAATAVVQAVEEQELAEEQARIARSRELAAAGLQILEVDPELSALLALQAMALAQTHEAENALHQAIPNLRLLRTFAGHTAGISGLAVSPNGALLATASQDGTARLWQLATGREVLTMDHPGGCDCVAFDPSGARLATCGDDGTLQVWRLSPKKPELSARQLYSVPAHTEPIADVAFSSDGTLLATVGRSAIVKVWDAATGQQLHTLTGEDTERPGSSLWAFRVTDLDFSPVGSQLAVVDADGRVRVWDVLQPVEAGSIEEQFILEPGPMSVVSSLAFSPDGTHLVTVQELGRTYIWNLSPGPNQGQVELDMHQQGESVAVSSDGKRLAVIDADGFTRVWNFTTGEEMLTLPRHQEGWLVAFPPQCKCLVTAGEDGTAKLWDLTTSREVVTLVGTGAGVAFSPDGTRLVTGARGGAIVWDHASGQRLHTMSAHDDRGVRNIDLSPDGAYVATAGNDATARIWDLASGTERLCLVGHAGTVWDVAFSSDGAYLATAGEDGTARVWDSQSGAELLTLPGHRERVYAVAFHPDGSSLATGSWDDVARIWDISSLQGRLEGGTETQAVALLFEIPRRGDVLDVVYSPDGSVLAVSDSDGLTTLWDVSDGEPRLLLTLKGHAGEVTRVDFSPDGKRLATASYDGMAKVWDATTGQELLTLSFPTNVLTSVCFSPDGRYLAATGEQQTRVFALRLEDLIDLAQDRLTRSLTDEECQQYLHLEECP